MRDTRNSIIVSHSAGPEPVEIHRGIEVTHAHPRHWHDEYLFCAITGGAGYTEYRGNAHFTPPGCTFALPPGEIHANYATSNDGCSYVNIYLPAARVDRTLSQVSQRSEAPGAIVTFSTQVHCALLSLCDVLEFSSSQLQRDSALLHFFRVLEEHDTSNELHAEPMEPRAIKLVREYLDAHFAEDIGLDFLAQLAELSPYHLNRIFRLQLGIPPHAYQVQRRIAYAKVLLRDNWPIADVAHQAGFADQSHLTRHFKRIVGTTPGQFIPHRKNVQDAGFAAD